MSKIRYALNDHFCRKKIPFISLPNYIDGKGKGWAKVKCSTETVCSRGRNGMRRKGLRRREDERTLPKAKHKTTGCFG